MAVAVSNFTAMNPSENNLLHPFFTKSHKQPNTADIITGLHPCQSDANEVKEQLDHGVLQNVSEDVDKKVAVPKVRRRKALDAKQKTLKDILDPRASTSNEGSMTTQNEVEIDEFGGSCKRRRITPSIEEDTANIVSNEPTVLKHETCPLPAENGPMSTTVESEVKDCDSATPAKRVLRLKPNGTFASPPSKHQDAESDQSTPRTPKRRGPQRRAKTVETKVPQLVKISYGRVEESRVGMGTRIEEIMAGKIRVAAPVKKPIKPSLKKPKKNTHPFFLGKAQTSNDTAPPSIRESPRKASAITPGKLRFRLPSDEVPDTSIPFVSALLKDRHMTRIPGASEAPWPQKDQVHVRGDQPQGVPESERHLHLRRHKEARQPLLYNESVLAAHAAALHSAEGPRLRPDGFFDPAPTLRLPERHLISGHEIAARVREQVSVHLEEDSDEDDLVRSHREKPTHPALQTLWRKLPSALSAFDEVRGEPSMWVEKYAPRSSANVLQSQAEVLALKTWLRSLAVHAVLEGPAPKRAPAAVLMSKFKKKRRKKDNELDDFIVDDDEDVRDMSELERDMTDDDGHGQKRSSQNSQLQIIADGQKLSTAVLLSGPQGSGKTAAVYAVAQELGFKVFELNPGERRSGRDIFDKVGDMTENHQMKAWQGEQIAPAPAVPDHAEEAFQRDLESGRQGKLNSFFKPKPQIKTSGPKKPLDPERGVSKQKVLKTMQAIAREPPKEQQQSVILLEEVDILFADDKEFWNSIFRLIVTSKRPCIMTCNDESAVPIQAMSLHALLRFQHAPVGLATDYMLLLAANEGHLLHRDAVKALYVSKHCDLRGSITDLNFWCQMGVGDPRGGLGWLFQRYPPGSDLDENGRQLRVVSSGTYKHGMGVLPEEVTSVEEWLSWAWQELRVDPLDLLERIHISQKPVIEHKPTNEASGRRQLRDSIRLSEALSDADACFNIMPEYPLLDPTQPELPDKIRAKYTEHARLLQTDEPVDYLGLKQDLLYSMITAAYRAYVPDAETTFASIPDRLLSKPDHNETALTRRDFSCLDSLAIPAESTWSGMILTELDGPFKPIVLDIAPYVRSIVTYDEALEEQRERLNLLTSDGRVGKRARTTRAARSALEGGPRATTRRERWFTKDLDVPAVLGTGGRDWPRPIARPLEICSRDGTEGTEAPVSSAE